MVFFTYFSVACFLPRPSSTISDNATWTCATAFYAFARVSSLSPSLACVCWMNSFSFAFVRLFRECDSDTAHGPYRGGLLNKIFALVLFTKFMNVINATICICINVVPCEPQEDREIVLIWIYMKKWNWKIRPKSLTAFAQSSSTTGPRPSVRGPYVLAVHTVLQSLFAYMRYYCIIYSAKQNRKKERE